jgi:hypothetical protein
MKASGIFGVIVRTIGLVFVLWGPSVVPAGVTEQPAGGDWVQPALPERLAGEPMVPLGSDKSTAARYCMRRG